ncbi:MAG: hypothetical protein R3211_02200 [Balneolaceae bacterium]|nr:hypothetical protein [Balneolaceae bacterium]
MPVADATAAVQERDQNGQPQEVFLSFRYRNLVNTVIIAIYEDGEFYLPVSEVFTLLKIPHQVELEEKTIRGEYLDRDNHFRINFSNYTVQVDDAGQFSFSIEEMQIRELDFYMKPEVFKEAFDIDFQIDFNNLLVRLQTPHTLPVLEQYQRAQERERANRFTFNREYYSLLYERERDLLDGGFLDYSISGSSIENAGEFLFYNLSGGLELLGGDLQGSASGIHSSNSSNFNTDNLRWRYVRRQDPWLTQAFLGQTRSDGLVNRQFTGVKLTNEPIEPRFIFDQFAIEGEAVPGSEVELFYNNALYDFQEVDGSGLYRFMAPLMYGSSRLNLKIYQPNGTVLEQSRRIQIPVTYRRPGEFNYSVSAGRLENPVFGSPERSEFVQGDLAYGINEWLTQRIGSEFLNEFDDQTPLFYSTTSARLFKQYLVSVDLAPTAFYRVTGNVIYASSASFGLEYIYFTDDGIYNVFGNDQELIGNAFLPFNLFDRPFNLRLNANHAIRTGFNNTQYSVDLNSRIERLNLRVGYRDRQFGDFSLAATNNAEFSGSISYFFTRQSALPALLRGTFLRGQLDYNPGLSKLERIDLQFSRNIFDTGQLQASFSRNFLGDFNLFSLGITFDLKPVRSSSTYRNTDGASVLSQNFRGSIGYDSHTDDVIFTNRQQVGRSALSARLFVDENNSGRYEQGETIIQDNAIRIDRSSIYRQDRYGTIRFSQLLAYNQINLEINQSAIRNPFFIPKYERFSLITDPNQYKPIDIPFYMAGVIEGRVERLQPSGDREPIPGIRVFVQQTDGSFSETLRTFSDGQFYGYEIPPGSYELKIDSTQLEFLDARSDPQTIPFELESRPDGDYVENLNFLIIPRSLPDDTTKQVEPDSTKPITKKSKKQAVRYRLQLASFSTLEKTLSSAGAARSSMSDSLNLVYNRNTSLFAIQSDSITEIGQALERISSGKSYRFPDPAVVITDAETDSLLRTGTWIEVSAAGPFRERAKAEELNDRLEQQYMITPTIYHDTFLNHYIVIVEEADAARLPADLQEDEMHTYLIPDRALAYKFELFITDLDEESLEIVKQTLDRVDQDIWWEYHRGDHRIVVSGIRSWRALSDLRNRITGDSDSVRAISVFHVCAEQAACTEVFQTLE